MTYTIQQLRHELSGFDQETVLFNFQVHPREEENLEPFPFHVHLSDVLYFLRDTDHPFYDYFNAVRNGLDKWGPAESATIEALGDEAVAQLYQFAEAYILQLPYMNQVFERERSFQSKENKTDGVSLSDQATKVVQVLSRGLNEMQKNQQRYYRFCETITRQARETAVSVYPELLNTDAEQIRELQHLFSSEIMSMHKKIERLLHKQ